MYNAHMLLYLGPCGEERGGACEEIGVLASESTEGERKKIPSCF